MKKAKRSRHHQEASLASRRRTLRPVVEHLEDRTVPAGQFIKNQLLVQYLPNVSAALRTSVRNTIHARLAETIHTQAMIANGDGILERWVLPTGLSVNTAISRVAVTPIVRFAEPNWTYNVAAVSNDPYYTTGSRLWGMYSDDLPSAVGPAGTTNQYGSWAEKAWNAGVTGSSSTYVGIIDEGIQYDHPDLVNNMWVNPFEIADGIDNDGNGYIDDLRGWDFFHNDNTIFDLADGDDHGTHVAGTIGAEGGNGQGVAGMNWDVTMIATKFLGPAGGSTAGAIKAADYLTDMKVRHGLNIVASSNSWAGGGFSQALLDAIVRGARQNILFVAAAGNSNNDNDANPSYPSNFNTTAGAGYDAVIAVAAINSSGAKSGFSSYGATTVDLGAPGEGIWSTLPTNTFGNYSGTSMATPHVSGAIALYASAYPGVSAQQIRFAILSGATPTASMNGRTVTGGRLNVWDAIGIAPSKPDVTINDVTVTEGNTGTTTATFTVSLSAATFQTVTVAYATKDGTATVANNDYNAASGNLTFNPGEKTKTISVTVNGDFAFENDEDFTVGLSNAVNANLLDDSGLGTILNDDVKTVDLTINDVTVVEGNTGTKTATFTVSMSAAFGQIVTVDYNTKDLGATLADNDYVQALGTLRFLPGETTKTISVTINGDFAFENDEDYEVVLSNASNATLVKDIGIGWIINDDVKSVDASINDVTVTEGNSGTTTATFTVSLSTAFGQIVSIDYLTKDLTATLANNDYVFAQGTVRFLPGETSKTISVLVNGDLVFENDEQFQVILSNAPNANLIDDTGIGTIINDDLKDVDVRISDVTKNEGDSGFTSFDFTVTLSGAFGQIVSVDYVAKDGTATIAGNDYMPTLGNVRFLPGETTKTITVLVRGDTLVEPDEFFTVALSNPVNATIADDTGVGTILNDDHQPIITVKIDDPSVIEGNAGQTALVFTLTLNAVSGTDSYVNWSTSDGSARVGDNDYIAASGTATIQAGRLATSVTVMVVGDRNVEINETFIVTLAPPTNITILKFQGVGTIINDDGTTGPPGGPPPGGGGPPPGGGLLQAEGGAVASNAPALQQRYLNTVVRQAQTFWASAGLTQAQLANLSRVQARVADLSGNILGQANGTSILIDSNAAGYGWFIDATPWNNSEFTRPGNQGEQNRMDLFSVVLHEMGHTLGLEHQDHGVMEATLTTGSRDVGDLSHLLHPTTGSNRNPALDALFSKWQEKENSRVAALIAQAVSHRT